MTSQHPYFIQKQNFTESRVAFAQEILRCEQQADFIFNTPDYVLAGGEKISSIQAEPLSGLNDALAQAKQQLQTAQQASAVPIMLMGGIPFANVACMDLMLMQQVQRYQKVLFDPQYQPKMHRQFKTGTAFVPSGQEYQQQVAYLVEQMRQGKLNKAVLARVLALDFAEEIDISSVFYQLTQANPEGYSYAVSSDPVQKGWFIGASPELLVGKKQSAVWSRPVAGTLARHADPVQDQNNAQQLLASRKDQHEHAVVIEMIADQLSPFCQQLHIPKKPELIKTQRLWHLATQIQGQLKDPDTHVLDLVQRLHPTPAICGQPTTVARDLIAQLEPFERELFAGTMGWADAHGDGEWSVTVRCARILGQQARLFAGAGIVQASSPEAEHAETAAKFRTVLDGFGLSPEQL